MRLIALAAFAGLLATGAHAGMLASVHQEPDGRVSVKILPPNPHIGWQAYFDYEAPTGINVTVEYPCPAGSYVANGAYYMNSAGEPGLTVGANHWSRTDPTKWVWDFNWPSGAPAGTHIFTSVNCQS